MFFIWLNDSLEINIARSCADYNFADCFNEKKRTKYLEVFVTAIRSVENGAMKVKFYGGDNKLNFKKQARPQIISLLQKRIKEMEKEAKKTDRQFRKN